MSQIAALKEVALYFASIFAVGLAWILFEWIKGLSDDGSSETDELKDELKKVDLSKPSTDVQPGRRVAFSGLRSRIAGEILGSGTRF